MDAVTFLSLRLKWEVGCSEIVYCNITDQCVLGELISYDIELLEQSEGGPCFYIVLVGINMFVSYSQG